MTDDAHIELDTDEVDASLAQIAFRLPRAVGGGLQAAGYKIIGTAQDKTPVDTGTLKGSAFVSDPVGSLTGGMQVIIGFGTEYAPSVHEATGEVLRGEPRPDPRKGNYWDDGESKFLEKAMNEEGQSALGVLRDTIHDVLINGIDFTAQADIPTEPETD